MFKIVEFAETKEISAVPHSWEKDNICYWPQKKTDAAKLIKNCDSVPDVKTWDAFEVKVIRRSLTTYNQAKQAEYEMSGYSTTDDEDRAPKSKRPCVGASLNDMVSNTPIILYDTVANRVVQNVDASTVFNVNASGSNEQSSLDGNAVIEDGNALI